ncbi:ATP-binding cassette transporter, partial [Clonorchis sinensis]
MPTQYLRRSTIAQQYRFELAQQLSTCTDSENVDEAWQNVKGAMLALFSAVCPTSPIRPQNHWISARSLSMIDARKSIPAGNAYDGARKSLKRQLVKSLRKDRELWWKSKAREREKAFATGNSRALYQPIRSTGPRKATVSETISEKDGSLIHSQKRRLERWAEHFEEQFSWPPATQPVEIMHTGQWNVNLDRPSEEEIKIYCDTWNIVAIG